jgi:hypothetical protein
MRLKRWDLTLHGVAMGACFVVLCEMEIPHIVVNALLMEISSVPLNLCYAKWPMKRDLLAILTQVMFLVSFFVVRMVMVPYIW